MKTSEKTTTNMLYTLLIALFMIGTVETVNADNDKGKGKSKAKTEKPVKKKRSITADYMVQSGAGIFVTQAVFSGICGTTVSPRYCRYNVTDEGKENIPFQETPYTAAQIDSFVSAGYLTPHPTATLRIWNP